MNNAGVSIYGRLEEVSERDARRLFEINFWGVYHGSMAILLHLKTHGGALINVGSEVSEAVVPAWGNTLLPASREPTRAKAGERTGFSDQSKEALGRTAPWPSQ